MKINVLVVTVSTVTRICRSASALRIVIQLGFVNQLAVVDQIIRDQLDFMARSYVSTFRVFVPIPADGQGLAVTQRSARLIQRHLRRPCDEF